ARDLSDAIAAVERDDRLRGVADLVSGLAGLAELPPPRLDHRDGLQELARKSRGHLVKLLRHPATLPDVRDARSCVAPGRRALRDEIEDRRPLFGRGVRPGRGFDAAAVVVVRA